MQTGPRFKTLAMDLEVLEEQRYELKLCMRKEAPPTQTHTHTCSTHSPTPRGLPVHTVFQRGV